VKETHETAASALCFSVDDLANDGPVVFFAFNQSCEIVFQFRQSHQVFFSAVKFSQSRQIEHE